MIGSGGGGEVVKGEVEAGIDGGADAGTGSNARGLIAMLESWDGEGAGVEAMLKGLGIRAVSSASKIDSGIELTGVVSLTSDRREGRLNILRGRG